MLTEELDSLIPNKESIDRLESLNDNWEGMYCGKWCRDRSSSFSAALQRMFPTYADKKVEKVQLLTESYLKYKREYVKHICFNPYADNLINLSKSQSQLV